MSNPPTAPVQSAKPDPAPDRQPSDANADALGGVTRLLGILRWLIDIGRQRTARLRLGAAPGTEVFVLFRRCRTRDIALVLARIRRGLMLAGALQAHLADKAARGQDVTPPKLPPLRTPSPAQAPAASRAPRRPAIADLPPGRMPTAEAIAEQLHRRPPGAILVDICRDLGIMADDLTTAQWRELEQAVMEYGGNVVTLLYKDDRLSPEEALAWEGLARIVYGWPKAAPPCSTGPPAGGEAIPSAA